MKDYCKKRCWVFGELDELILYDSSGWDMFKGSEFLEKFRQRYRDGPKTLSFSDWVHEPTQQMTDVKSFMEKMFDKIEGKVEDVEQVLGEDGEPVVPTLEVHPTYLKGCEATAADELQRPHLRLARLEVTEPTAVPF